MANFKKVKLQNLCIYELSTIVAGQTVNKNKQQQNRGENRRKPPQTNNFHASASESL